MLPYYFHRISDPSPDLVLCLFLSWILHVLRKKMSQWVRKKGGIPMFYSFLLT